MSDTATRINDTLAQHFGVASETLRPDTKLIDDLLFDSLDMVELAMALEEEFQIDIPDDDWENAADMTLTQVADLIDGRLKGRKAA